jgi:hypothetical protein
LDIPTTLTLIVIFIANFSRPESNRKEISTQCSQTNDRPLHFRTALLFLNACLVNSSTMKKTSVEHWRNHTDRRVWSTGGTILTGTNRIKKVRQRYSSAYNRPQRPRGGAKV